MFESIVNFFKRLKKAEEKNVPSKDTAKERLHLVLMQDRANVSADFLELMKQEIIEVIKKYIDVEEEAIDVRLTNEIKEDGTTGAPSLYANIPIVNIKNEMKKEVEKEKIEKEKIEKEKKILYLLNIQLQAIMIYLTADVLFCNFALILLESACGNKSEHKPYRY